MEETDPTGAQTSKYRKIRNKRTLVRQIFNHLSCAGFDDFESFLANPEWAEYDPAEIVKFINDFSRKSQLCAEIETKQYRASIQKIAELLAPSVETPVAFQPKNEIALAVDAIAHLETSPLPGNAPVVHLDAVYHHIANLMKGEPGKELHQEDVNVIHEAVKEVMAEVESPQGQRDMQKLMDLMINDKYDAFTQDQAMELKALFGDETFNPLRLPMEFLVNKPFFDRSS